MPKFEILNVDSHSSTRVNVNYTSENGYAVSNTPTFPTEFADVQSEYPILFRKDPETGQFNSFVMLGFQADENLFLTDDGWAAEYIPASLARGPFLIGFQNQEEQGKSAKEPVINIDMADPRVSENEGEKLFNDSGSLSPFAENIKRVLSGIHLGIEYSKQMFEVFLQHDLLESVTIDAEFNNGEKAKIQGCYTIHEEKLKMLDAAALEILNRTGYLQAAYLVIASLSNIRKLISMKNKQIDKQSN
jgi:hypothetical protein